MSFFDTLMMPQHDGTLETKLYSTESPPSLIFIFTGIDATPYHTNIVSSALSSTEPKLCVPTNSYYSQEKAHLEEMLQKCKYPMWELNMMKFKNKNSHQSSPGNSNNNNSDNQENQTRPGCKKEKVHIVVLYIQGLSESFKSMENVGIKYTLKGDQTFSGLLVDPQGQIIITKKGGLMYRLRCGRCDDEYIG